jgi:hypothetical protein
MSTKSRDVWNLEKNVILTKGCAEIHIQRHFFDNENGIWKILVLKIQMVGTCFGAPSPHKILFF